MPFQPDPTAIVWRLHLRSSPQRVYDVLDSDAGRASFWAESAVEVNGVIDFEFINGFSCEARVLTRRPPQEWSIDYFNSVASFRLESDGAGGTDLTLVNENVATEDRNEVTAGWLNVLFPLKAWVDHAVDLRSHDPARIWDAGYVDQ